MSELGGRANNGGARNTGGPVPVSSSTSAPPSGILRPTEIMRNRNDRERRKQEDQKALEAQQQRESVERRAAALQGTAAPRNSQASSQYTTDSQQQPFDVRRSGTGQVAGSQVLGDPTGRRGPSSSQQDQPRAVPTATAGPSRRTQPTQPGPRQSASSATAGAAAPPAGGSTIPQQPPPDPSGSGRDGAGVAFPHAFHRWENLSAHWEGLTSFWLRRLEENTEKIRETIPNITTLNRQITDLSAAGANLFHAVVELQRLRASSERKFQRWFFDTRGESEKNKEIQGRLEQQLRAEREEASRLRADALMQAENARREAAEVRRELAISKDEARRAWEELGRRNQESLETAQSLKDGRITLVHGVQVVPYAGGPSRSGSASQRPMTREGQGYYGSAGMGGGGYASPGDEAEYYYQEGSPTNTDPFMESGPSGQPQPLTSATYIPGYQVGGTPTTNSTAQTAIPASRQRTAPVSTQEAERFYQHPPHEAFLHGTSQNPAQSVGGGGSASGPSVPRTRQDVQSEVSYVDTISEGGTEYAMDAGGNVQYDNEGRPIIVRRRTRTNESRDDGGDDDDDDYDADAIRREQEHSARYGTGFLTEAPTVPATSSQAMQSYATTSTAGAGPGAQSLPPGYEGTGYSGASSAGPETMQTRHHHPTRLSDIQEREEERSSQRTGD